jgi:hypothetical protein
MVGIGRNVFSCSDKCIIEGQEHLKSYITNYYKNMFETLDEGNFSMDKTRTDDIPQISMEDNDLLIAEYSEEEVRKTIFKMEHNKAPDGFPAEFLSNFLGYYQIGSSKIV